jgi:hypothetical protein
MAPKLSGPASSTCRPSPDRFGSALSQLPQQQDDCSSDNSDELLVGHFRGCRAALLRDAKNGEARRVTSRRRAPPWAEAVQAGKPHPPKQLTTVRVPPFLKLVVAVHRLFVRRAAFASACSTAPAAARSTLTSTVH